MSKIHFIYGTVNSAKTTDLITKAYFMESIGKKILCLLPSNDCRSNGVISSRTGLKRTDNVVLIHNTTDLNDVVTSDVDAVFVDEVQFLNQSHIIDMVGLSNKYGTQFFCYGLKSDFKRKLFPAIEELVAHTTDMTEMKSYCSECGKHKAIYNAKFDLDGNISTEGASISPGYNYKGVCAQCYDYLRSKIK